MDLAYYVEDRDPRQKKLDSHSQPQDVVKLKNACTRQGPNPTQESADETDQLGPKCWKCGLNGHTKKDGKCTWPAEKNSLNYVTLAREDPMYYFIQAKKQKEKEERIHELRALLDDSSSDSSDDNSKRKKKKRHKKEKKKIKKKGKDSDSKKHKTRKTEKKSTVVWTEKAASNSRQCESVKRRNHEQSDNISHRKKSRRRESDDFKPNFRDDIQRSTQLLSDIYKSAP